MNQDTPLVASRPLLVIYTGGTLGMVQGAEGLVPGGDIEARLARALAALNDSTCFFLFVLLESFCIYIQWNALVNCEKIISQLGKNIFPVGAILFCS